MHEVKPEVFKASLPIQIRFGDIDAMGHINNNIYLSYFDLGKTDYFDLIKPMAISWTEGLIVVAHIEIDFLSPIYYKEKIVVETKIKKLGEKSGIFLQQLRNIKTNEIKCRCESVFVAYNAQTQSSMLIPDEWREVISTYEEMEFERQL